MEELLKKAPFNQANAVMELRADGWQLEDAYPYTYEDEEHIDQPDRTMFMLVNGERTVFVNEAGARLYQINKGEET